MGLTFYVFVSIHDFCLGDTLQESLKVMKSHRAVPQMKESNRHEKGKYDRERGSKGLSAASSCSSFMSCYEEPEDIL